MKLITGLFCILCGAVLASVLFDLMTSKADVVFLVVTGSAFLSVSVRNRLYSRFYGPDGNDPGIIALSLIALIDAVIIIFAPFLVLFGLPYVPVMTIALAFISIWTIYVTFALIT